MCMQIECCALVLVLVFVLCLTAGENLEAVDARAIPRVVVAHGAQGAAHGARVRRQRRRRRRPLLLALSRLHTVTDTDAE